MPARLAILVSTTAALMACSPSDEQNAKTAARDATPETSHIIPREYRGRWAEMPAACLTHNSRRYEIAAGRIDTATFGGDVEEVRLNGRNATVRLLLEAGEADFAMTLHDANTMQARYGEREAFTLHLCR